MTMSNEKDELLSERDELLARGGTEGGAPAATDPAATSDATAAPDEQDEVARDPLGTVVKLWRAAGRERWRLVVAACSAVGLVLLAIYRNEGAKA